MSSLTAALAPIAVAIGALPPLQAGINATLGRHAGTPFAGALTNTLVASACLIVAIMVLRVPLPSPSRMLSAPWWAYSGGLCGAAMVLGAIVLAPRLGAAGYVTATILGTVTASLLLDHFGLVGYAERAVSLPRLAGAGLVFAGMLLIIRY